MFNRPALTPKELEEQKILHQKAREEQKQQEELQKHLAHIQLSLFEKIEKYINEKELEKQAINFKEELITINFGGYDFENNGLKYCGLVVSDFDANTNIVVDYKGIKYSISLQSGFNKVNIPNGARLTKTSGDGITVGLIKTNFEI